MQKYGISTTTTDTGTPSKLEAEARKPSGWEFFPFMWLGSIALGLVLAAWIGIRDNARDILPYLVTGFFVGISIPLMAVVIFTTLMTAYGLRKQALYTFERWRQVDANKDGVIGDPAERFITIRGGYAAPSEPVQSMTMAEFVRKCSEHGTAWHSTWSENGTLKGPISQDEWKTKRNILIGAQKADWNNRDNPNAGWHLTASADTIIRELGK
jgi:hypothetical protein